jgi:hypothetical protein
LLLPLVFLGRLQIDYANHTDFTMVERLLTQARVLREYLAVLLLPTTGATGIFHDIPVSISLFSPLTTFIAIAARIVLLLLVMYKPGHHRIWLFCVLWFFSGHLVESSVLALELFFHHRNYLAFYGFVFALVFAFIAWLPAKLLNPRLRVAIAVLYLFLLASNTVRISQLWTQPLYLADAGMMPNLPRQGMPNYMPCSLRNTAVRVSSLRLWYWKTPRLPPTAFTCF